MQNMTRKQVNAVRRFIKTVNRVQAAVNAAPIGSAKRQRETLRLAGLIGEADELNRDNTPESLL